MARRRGPADRARSVRRDARGQTAPHRGTGDGQAVSRPASRPVAAAPLEVAAKAAADSLEDVRILCITSLRSPRWIAGPGSATPSSTCIRTRRPMIGASCSPPWSPMQPIWPDANGRSLFCRQLSAARLDGGLAFARGNLPPRPCSARQRPATPTARCPVRHRRCVELGRAALPTAGPGEAVGAVNAHYERGVSALFYTHVTARQSPYHTVAILPSGEAAHVIDGLLYYEASLSIATHHTDGGGGRCRCSRRGGWRIRQLHCGNGRRSLRVRVSRTDRRVRSE